eukprot:21743-Eustigmatos_ZCMA.PRE.1
MQTPPADSHTRQDRSSDDEHDEQVLVAASKAHPAASHEMCVSFSPSIDAVLPFHASLKIRDEQTGVWPGGRDAPLTSGELNRHKCWA